MYWSWIWKFPVFKQLYYIHKWIFKKTQKWERVCKINILWIKWLFKTNIWKSSLSKDIMISWYYEKEISKYIINNLNKWDIFLDVWANLWYYSILTSKCVWENWIVYSFEPVKENFDYLIDNIKLNKLNNIKTFNFWLWEKEEELYININNDNNWNNSIVINDENRIKEKIQIRKFDNLNLNGNENKIKIIKIDVEWFEFEVIKWMKKLLTENSSIEIIMEFSPQFYKKIWKNYTLDFINYLKENWFKTYVFSKDTIKIVDLNKFINIFQMDILIRK